MDDYYDYRRKSEAFSTACMVLGIASIVMVFIPPLILGCIPAGLSILFYALNNNGQKRTSKEKTGLTTAIIGMVLSLTMMIFCGLGIYNFFHDPSFHDQVNTLMKDRYGYTVDDFLVSYGIIDEEVLPNTVPSKETEDSSGFSWTEKESAPASDFSWDTKAELTPKNEILEETEAEPDTVPKTDSFQNPFPKQTPRSSANAGGESI